MDIFKAYLGSVWFRSPQERGQTGAAVWWKDLGATCCSLFVAASAAVAAVSDDALSETIVAGVVVAAVTVKIQCCPSN